MLEASVEDPTASETVIRFLDREADLTTRYGGGFVQSINGVAGEIDDGRTSDWFFFVNGIESPVGSADREVRGGDRIWWDYRDWTNAMRAPAVVGSFPEPFAQASTPEAERDPVTVDCLGDRDPCDRVFATLADAGVEVAAAGEGGEDALRLLIGPWDRVRDDEAAAQIERGPATSGVWARFAPFRSGYELLALDQMGDVAWSADEAAGLVAAVRRGSDPPTWVVTGVDDEGVALAAEALDAETLANRYALFTSAEVSYALPTERASG
jgi:hypothetical protein